MPILKLELDAETYDRLISKAATERRPISWQAEVILRRGLGLPFPHVFKSISPNRVDSRGGKDG